mmetsp:Transcript_10169/g.13328  ORF Transcript_10169/g.13328 Transcript_10169/m.13328 type:complete len:159 (+) Transcript_10169:133-609(+)
MCIVLLLSTLAAGGVMSILTRNIPGLFSEAKYIMLSTYNIIVIVCIAGLIGATTELNYLEFVLILTLSVAYVTVSSSFMIVGTRCYVAYKKIEFSLYTTKSGKLIAVRGDKTTTEISIMSGKQNSIMSSHSAMNDRMVVQNSATGNYPSKFKPKTENK